MDDVMFSFPHKVCPWVDHQTHAHMAQWCLRNISIHDWLHDPRQFEFRHHSDMVMFALAWSVV
jgi:hypothetical protein